MSADSELPDILNSKTKEILLELPGYAYSHSSSAEDKTKSFFLGRKKLITRLKSMIISSSSKTGVYLVTGTRGVGKSSMVEEVINDTSLPKNKRKSNFIFLIVALFLVLLLQYVSNQIGSLGYNSLIENLGLIGEVIDILIYGSIRVLVSIGIILLMVNGYCSYLRKEIKVYDVNYIKNRLYKLVWHILVTAIREFLLLLPNNSNPFLRTQNVVKLALILIICHILAVYASFVFTHLQIFVIYLCIVLGGSYAELLFKNYMETYRKFTSIYKRPSKYEYKCDDKYSGNHFQIPRMLFLFIFVTIFLSLVIITFPSLFVSILPSSLGINLPSVIGYLCWALVFVLTSLIYGRCVFVRKIFKITEEKCCKVEMECLIKPLIKSIFGGLRDYIKNGSRVYLKINFGHDILKERDILRLITRTLSTEYDNFCRSWKHTFHWRILASAVILFASYLFYKNIYIKDLRPSIEQSDLYKNMKNAVTDSLIEDTVTYDITSKIENIEDTVISSFIKKGDLKNMEDKVTYSFTNKPENMKDTVFQIQKHKTKNRVTYYFIQADKAINSIWRYIYNAPEYFWTKKEDLAQLSIYKFPPINYAGLLIVLIFYLFGKLLLRTKLFTTHYAIKKQFRQLNESITHNIESEVGTRVSYSIINVGAKKKKSRLIADEREIEKELQDVLSNVKKIPMFMARPEFVIVFDELDKVSPEFLNKEEFTQTSETRESIFAQNSIRDRQTVIMKLLSNMKYFLCTANAKFIFIAGREMYDMYLADIADRSSYFGSIFDDVIFVPSLLSDDHKHITALPEEFVCRHSIPENYPTAEWNLKVYQQYLNIYFGIDVMDREKNAMDKKKSKLQKEIKKLEEDKNAMDRKKSELQKEIEKLEENKKLIEFREKEVNRKIQKIIATLQQFIIYLSHTSKGAPKKMMQVFESFIVYLNPKLEPRDADNKKYIVRQYSNSPFFLSFGYYRQFTIGITSYLVSPVITRLVDSNIKERSDKLLVSTLHFVDYMLKFHSQNFTWRQLDISPEVIETNHPSELKAVINDVVTLYEQIHLTKPIISLFDFKFDNLFSQEISFISKLDERFSAQFSFSLDESLALKQHYGNLLRKQQLEYKEYKGYGKTFVSSISSLQLTLGDLHFLDDEFDEAAIYYKDSLYLLGKNMGKNLELSYLLIRNQFKLAYLYEKRKQPEFAYSLYKEMVNSVTKYSPCNNDMSLECLQLFYLPLLAKLQILEKCSAAGILGTDIEQTEKDFKSLINTIKHKDIRILTADFYSKVGDILYYKGNNVNGMEISHYACYYYKKVLIALALDEGEQEKDFYKKTILQILKDKLEFIYTQTSTKYCGVMARVLSDLGDVYFQKKKEMCNSCEFKTSYILILKKRVKIRSHYEICKYYYRYDKISDFWRSWHELFTEPEFELNNFLNKTKIDSLSNIELALFLYSLSMKFYEKASLYKQSAFQITKILTCFKFCLKRKMYNNEISTFCNEKEKDDIENLKYITSRAIEFLYMANDGLDVFEVLKRKEDFNDEAKLQYIQVDSEIIRINVLKKELELRLSNEDKRIDILHNLYANYIISPYHINYSVSARVRQLSLKAKLNRETYKIIKEDVGIKTDKNIYFDILTILTADNDKWEKGKTREIFKDDVNIIEKLPEGKYTFFALLEMLVADSIFCNTKILRLIQTSNDSYIFNHSFFADIYRRLANWTEIYEVLKHIISGNKNDYFKDAIKNMNISSGIEKNLKDYLTAHTKIDNYLADLLGEDFREQLSSRYYRQRAFLHYQKLKETHTGGRAYFNLLEQMYFIRGDYDDVVSHFHVAVERFMINKTNGYKEHLKELEKKNAKSSLYKSEKYFEGSNNLHG
jgi:hypothetical protein